MRRPGLPAKTSSGVHAAVPSRRWARRVAIPSRARPPNISTIVTGMATATLVVPVSMRGSATMTTEMTKRAAKPAMASAPPVTASWRGRATPMASQVRTLAIIPSVARPQTASNGLAGDPRVRPDARQDAIGHLQDGAGQGHGAGEAADAEATDIAFFHDPPPRS